jgi:hypothetical protein
MIPQADSRLFENFVTIRAMRELHADFTGIFLLLGVAFYAEAY